MDARDMIKILELSWAHLLNVFTALLITTPIAVGLGILAFFNKKIKDFILTTIDTIQTIPSLALLAILMMFFGLGNTTLIVGLLFYSLLPIVRNTYLGFSSVPEYLVEAAKGMGMSKVQRLFKVQLPIAFPFIFSGIRIAAVTALGIAVIGVLIGADGLGDLVYQGIQRQDTKAILSGSIPIVVLALMFNYIMLYIENRLLRHRNV